MKAARARKKKNSRFTAFLIALCIVLIAVLSIYIAKFYKLKNNTQRDNEVFSSIYENGENKENPIGKMPEAENGNDEGTQSEAVLLPYPRNPENVLSSFEGLIEINNDTVGYLHIPARTVDDIKLPVVQRDNSFYLNHDFYGRESKAGTVFLDSANSIWPQDEHLILYGHNMKNGTMLARITRYKSLEYARNNPILYFDTLYEKGTYVVLAALQLPAEEMQTYDFNIRTFTFGETSFDAFMYAVRKKAYYVTSAGADENDQLLSIMTCSYNEDDERFLLMARRLRENETEEDIYALAGK